MKKQGVTLTELLVTMALLAIAMAAMVQFFITQTRASQLQKATNEANEAARIALSLISWDLQNAGYLISTSATNPAISATGSGTSSDLTSYKDAFSVRYFDREAGAEQTIRYELTGSPLSLFRTQNGVSSESVASIVGMNVLYETRANQFELPTDTGSSRSCPAGTEAIPQGATGAAIENCRGIWEFKNAPNRLVRQIRVQVLARSTQRITKHTSPNFTFDDEGATQVAYQTEDGYVYQFAEQAIIAANLGR